MSATADDDFLLVGNLCRDIVLLLPAFPREDADMRVAARSATVGGNAANAALVVRQLLPQSASRRRVRLVATLGDAVACGDSAACLAALAAATVDTSACVAVPGATLPVSTVLVSQVTGSRTILSHRSMRDLVAEDGDADASCRGASVVHVEHRGDAAAMHWLRAARAAACAIVSVEFEKMRGGDAVAARTQAAAAASLCDVIILGHDYCVAVGRPAVNTNECCPLPPRGDGGPRFAGRGCGHTAGVDMLLRVGAAAPPRALVVAPWGADGALASIPTAASGSGRCGGAATAPGRACDDCVRAWKEASASAAAALAVPPAALLVHDADRTRPGGDDAGQVGPAGAGHRESTVPRCPGRVLVVQPAVICTAVVDTRGAGDTFTAALLVAMAQARTARAGNAATDSCAALAFAVAVAGAKCGVAGLDVGTLPAVVAARGSLAVRLGTSEP